MNWDNVRLLLVDLVEYFNIRQFFHDNSPLRLALILGIMLLMFAGASFFCALFRAKLEKLVRIKAQKPAEGAEKPIQAMDLDLFAQVMKYARQVLMVLILYWGMRALVINQFYAEAVRIIFTLLWIFSLIRFLDAFAPFNIDIYLRRRGITLRASQARSLIPIVKCVIWAIGLTFMLDNLGLHVSTIVAGLGIVGVAVGLAGQAILADFFSYLVILLDKPFKIGDFVELSNGKSGAVTDIGPKTTRLLNMKDEVVVCANSEMTKGILVNQGSMDEMPVVINIGVAYSNSAQVMERVPAILREVVNSFPECDFNRAVATVMGSANLIYQLIYTVKNQPAGLLDFERIQTRVNIAILDRLGREKIPGAYPTQEVLLSFLNSPPRPQPARTS